MSASNRIFPYGYWVRDILKRKVTCDPHQAKNSRLAKKDNRPIIIINILPDDEK